MIEIINELRKFYRQKGIPTILDEGLSVLLQAVKDKQPTNILEIGTATGMSAIAMSLTCPTAHITTIEIMENSFLESQKNFKEFKMQDKISGVLGDSLQVLENIEGEYDFVFLDGSKSKYKKCLELIEPRLKKGAIVVADNVLFRGYILDKVECPKRYKTIKKYMREFLDYMLTDSKYKTTLYQVGDGVTVSEYLKGE
ncbi:MAG: O-methyltransferase [Clostridia bacterium]|nr:O-methyltransferase [Clostridia bacterium]